MGKYLTAPVASPDMPKGIPYIIGNEAAERFSFYGMKAILTVFMTKYIVDSSGELDLMSGAEASAMYHLFVTAVYFTPIIGALVADIFFGKYKTILSLSVVYCLGHFALALDETRTGLTIGLTLIAIGSGGIKPCVSAHVGDQFGKTNANLLSKVFSWFYFSINLGSAISTLLTPLLLAWYGPHLAFGLPGLLMLIATITFWLGRKEFVHIPAGGKVFVKETFNEVGIKTILRLFVIVLFISVFWSLFDQTGSSWVLQADRLDRNWLGFDWLPSQIQAANPIMVMILIPIFTFFIYPTMGKFFKVTPLRKISIGFFIAAASFAIVALTEQQITGGVVGRISSNLKVELMVPMKLLDGVSDQEGWSSTSKPTANSPEEIMIALRERSAWDINEVVLSAATVMNPAELSIQLDEYSLDLKKQRAALVRSIQGVNSLSKSLDINEDIDPAQRIKTLTTNAEILSNLSYRLKGMTQDEYAKAKAEVSKVLTDTGFDASILDVNQYRPKEVMVFAANFTDKLIPKSYKSLLTEYQDVSKESAVVLKDHNKTTLHESVIKRLAELKAIVGDSPIAWANHAGWKHVGTLEVDAQSPDAKLSFGNVKATHVLFVIRSNQGAPRVKLSEVVVNSPQMLPDDSVAKTSGIWPNVAGIGYQPNIMWQLLAYLILTAAEVMVSITALEFFYAQSPKAMKSFIMSIYLLSVSIGNFFAFYVNSFISKKDGTSIMEGASYFWFFTAVMGVTAVLFIGVAILYKEKTYIQDELPTEEEIVDEAITNT